MRITLFLTFSLFVVSCFGQDTWTIEAKAIDPKNYYGVTVGNGMIGLVSSPEPMKVQDVVLNGVYDYYQRGRVSNILKTFNHANMNLEVDGKRIGIKDITNYKQSLDMKKAILVTTYDVGDKVSVKHSMMALRHLPYTAMSMVEIRAKHNVRVTPMSV
ncbi:MAG: glycosyl hydrolase family 65, partial [Azospira oryzae]